MPLPMVRSISLSPHLFEGYLKTVLATIFSFLFSFSNGQNIEGLQASLTKTTDSGERIF